MIARLPSEHPSGCRASANGLCLCFRSRALAGDSAAFVAQTCGMRCCIADERAAADVPGYYLSRGAAAIIFPCGIACLIPQAQRSGIPRREKARKREA